MSDLLALNNISKSYRRGRKKSEVLRDVSFGIPAGSLTAITGPSGSGKSTLLRIMGGLSRPSSGQVTYDDKNLYRLRDRALSRLRNQTFGFVFQDYKLIEHYTVIQNTMIPLLIAGTPRHVAKSRAAAALNSVGLGDYITHRVVDLSGGQRQRVGIARALVTEPAVLLADEPTGNLDTQTGESIIKILRTVQQKRGTTVVIVTHNPDIAKLADRHIKLRDGRIVGGAS